MGMVDWYPTNLIKIAGRKRELIRSAHSISGDRAADWVFILPGNPPE
jgi:hypothetical protein